MKFHPTKSILIDVTEKDINMLNKFLSHFNRHIIGVKGCGFTVKSDKYSYYETINIVYTQEAIKIYLIYSSKNCRYLGRIKFSS